MPKMDKSSLTSMLASQKADALAAMSNAQLMADRAKASDYYNGHMEADMPAQDGRSSTVSMDVMEAVEGILPNMMDIIAGSDEIVHFEPVGPEDEEAAQQETDYVNHVLMQMNDGWRVLYDFTKDGLLSKVGVTKVWWEEREKEQRETYYDLSDEQFMMLSMAVAQSDGAMEIVEHTVNGEANEQAETQAQEEAEPSEASS